MDKRFIIILAAVIALVAGAFVITKKDNSGSNTDGNNSSSATTSNHSSGNGSVELVEYGDFECPACGQFYPLVEQIREKYGDRLKFTFRHFPIDSIHPNARAAHRSAEAAAIQGKFFEMYNLLYQNQTTWRSLSNPVTVFEDYAAQLGLNLDKFKSDFATQAVNETINADIKEGKDKYKADSTPTFVLNGQKLVSTDVGSIELFSAKIDEALAAAENNTTPAETTPTP